MRGKQEGLVVRVGEVDQAADTKSRIARLVQRAEIDFSLQQERQRMQTHRELLQEGIHNVLSPYEQMLRVIAEEAEVRRLALLASQAGGQQRGLKARFAKKFSPQDTALADGEYTETWFVAAEDKTPYPFEMRYRAEGKGPVGEEGGRQVTPIRYIQLLHSGTDFPQRERRGDDIMIELKDGKVDDVSISVFREMWQNKETDLLTNEGTEGVREILTTGFVAPRTKFNKTDAIIVSLQFSSLQEPVGEQSQDPKLVIQHNINYGWHPKNFEYTFAPGKNQFRHKRIHTYPPERFTSLLQSTLRILPATPITV